MLSILLICLETYIMQPANALPIVRPNAWPTEHFSSNPNLYVSAENPKFKNYFAGPQVIEVMVSDPNISRLDEAYGEPVVTVNGHPLRMTQTTDGNWYAYFADVRQAQLAAATQMVENGGTTPTGLGLSFGAFCSPTSAFAVTGVDFSETKGIAIAESAVGASYGSKSPSTVISSTCTGFSGTLTGINPKDNFHYLENVVRLNKTMTEPNGVVKIGQIGYSTTKVWPVVQLYDFSALPTPVTVDYNRAGGDQIVHLTFDRIPSNIIGFLGNRFPFPPGSYIQADLIDPQLNIDPTDVDSWTWTTNQQNNTLFYRAFDDSGLPEADGTPAMQNLVGNLTSMMFNHNGRLISYSTTGVAVTQETTYHLQTVTPDPQFPGLYRTKSLSTLSVPATLAEVQPNTGLFANYDASGVSSAQVLSDAPRGGFYIVRYNDVDYTGESNDFSGSMVLAHQNGTWHSGKRLGLRLNDTNDNLNALVDEHINDYDGSRLRIPTMIVGSPFTLYNHTPPRAGLFSTQPQFGQGKVLSFTGLKNATYSDVSVDESSSHRPVFIWHNGTSNITIKNGGGLVVDTNDDASDLFQDIHNSNSTIGPDTVSPSSRFHGFNFLNFDLRSFSSLNGATGSDPTGVNVYLVYNTAGTVSNLTGYPENGDVAISIVNGSSLENFVNLNDSLMDLNPQSGFQDVNSHLGAAISGAKFDKEIFGIPPTADIGFMFLFNETSGQNTNLPAVQTSTTGEAYQSIATPVVTDFFSFGIIGDGTNIEERVNNAIYRWELEETAANSNIFNGTTQFMMLNEVNLLNPTTYSQLRTVNHDVLFAAIQEMLASEGRAPSITYLDLGGDGVNKQISALRDIPTTTGTVSFDQKTYKIGDTVTVTVNDPDLNTNNDLIVVYNTVRPTLNSTGYIAQTGQDQATDTVGAAGLGTYSDGRSVGRMLDVQWGLDDQRWTNEPVPNVSGSATCFTGTSGHAIFSNTGTPKGFATDFAATGFSLVETAVGSGVFTGTFEVPDHVCENGVQTTTNGQNIKVNYVDFRDESGRTVEISDNAGIRGNTGSVKLDKAVYPVPFGGITTSSTDPTANFASSTVGTLSSYNGVFPLHRDLSGTGLIQPTQGATASNPAGTIEALPTGNVIVHARVNDPDYTTAATGTNFIAVGVWYANSHTHVNNGPVAFQISRQGQSVLLATAGGPSKHGGHIINLNGTQLPAINATAWSYVPDLGPMAEISPGAGIFQADLPIELTDGPPGTDCPVVTNWDGGINGTGFTTNMTPNGANGGTAASHQGGRFWSPPPSGSGNYCVRQGDVLTVTYYDTADASGNPQTVTDSATFDLRNGVLQSDKSVYIIGSDMILTLVEPDLNLDSQTAETLPLDLVEWDSHAYKGTMGPLGGQTANFDAKPSTFVETGKDTGIFQAIVKIPKQLGTTLLERGEQINLEYTDWGPAGSKTVGANSQDIELTIYTSNFGATVELDQKVYTWTDRVYITVVAPDHNFDPNLIDTIGTTSEDSVIVSTRGNSIYYKLSETGVDTGIFTGYVILTGDPTLKSPGGVDGEGTEPTGIIGNGQPNSCTQSDPCGPTDGFLPSSDQDGVSVSFEFTRDQTVTGSALIRWNIGEISWLQPSYPANGQGVLQIVDPDMNLNPKAVDKFDTNVWSDSDAGGIKLTMVETGQDTGIFQGTVYFTTNFQSSGNRLHVSEGDTVTGEYKDRTLPPPYTPADQLRLTATTFIGTIVPPLERAPASNPRIVDSFGNAINGTVKVGQQIQVTADLANGQNRDQPFAYLVQIQDSNGVTVSLSWITGTLSAGQSLNPAQSWTPSTAGTYTAQIFVWQSIDNPNALSPPLSVRLKSE